MIHRHRNSSNTFCWCCSCPSPCPPPAAINIPGKHGSTIWGKYLLFHATIKLWGRSHPTEVWAGTLLLLGKARDPAVLTIWHKRDELCGSHREKSITAVKAELSDQLITSHLLWGFTPTSGGQPVCDAGPCCSLITFPNEHLCVCFPAVPHALEEPPSMHLPINSSFSSQALFKALLCLWCLQACVPPFPNTRSLAMFRHLRANTAADYAGQRGLLLLEATAWLYPSAVSSLKPSAGGNRIHPFYPVFIQCLLN